MRSIVKGAVLVACTAALTSALALPATADPTQPVASTDITAVGSDTIEYLGNDLAAAYNGQTPAPASLFDSWNATGTSPITVKPGVSIPRPNGSSAGIKALQADTANPPAIDIARSSRGPQAGDTGVLFIPIAEDTVQYALSAQVPSNGVDGLTAAQLSDIYTCVITNWSQVGGPDAPIQPMLPQAGSGTRSFFLGQLGNITPGSCVITVQEHDPAPIQGNANALAPFSAARFSYPVDQSPNITLNTAGFFGYRPVYLVVRDAGGYTVPLYLQDLIGDGTGTNGWICSAAGQAVVAQNGFTALPDFTASTCGVAEHI